MEAGAETSSEDEAIRPDDVQGGERLAPASRARRRALEPRSPSMRRMAAVLVAIALCGCGDTGDRSAPSSEGRPRVEVIATGLEIPWELAFLPDGRALVTERPGRIRMLDARGRLQARPVARVQTQARGEGGLLGLALDPRFERNHWLYLFFTSAEGMQLERWHMGAGDRLTYEADLVRGIEAGDNHDSGRIAFGPDDRLYVATGDAAKGPLAQNPSSLNGKFLRLAPEQYHAAAPVRPEIFSSGHRNPQGFDWEPGTNRLIATEHGPSGPDGPRGSDEINLILQGRNYGWPAVVGSVHTGFEAPLRVYKRAIAPSGATFVTRKGSAWSGDYLFANLIGRQLRHLRFNGEELVVDEPLLKDRFGRLRTVVEGPDGALYVLTSNRDGRGAPVAEDDRILRLTPPPARER
jgi:glucose/arabinose dehydrogenase